jgi:hypothetical protein
MHAMMACLVLQVWTQWAAFYQGIGVLVSVCLTRHLGLHRGLHLLLVCARQPNYWIIIEGYISYLAVHASVVLMLIRWDLGFARRCARFGWGVKM